MERSKPGPGPLGPEPGMNGIVIAIIGGAGVRAPLLVPSVWLKRSSKSPR